MKPLTPEQYQKAIDSGFSPDQIIEMEKVRKSESMGLSEKIQSEIAERGTIQDSLRKIVSPSSGTINRVLGTLESVGDVFSAPVSAVANPIIAAQAGNFNPLNAYKEMMLGLSGQKKGSASDIYRGVGVPKTISDVAGFATEVAVPIGIARQGFKILRRGSKITDKNLENAGRLIVEGADEARKALGKNVSDIFKTVGTVKADGMKFIDAVSKFPKSIVSAIETELGKAIEDIAKEIDINTIRQIKQIVGDMKFQAFGRGAKGISETLDSRKIDKGYSSLLKLIEETIPDKKMAKKLLDADSAFTEAASAANYLKRSVVDATTKKATKAGRAAEKLASRTDLTFRDSINVLRQSGKVAEKKLNKAVDALNAFNDWQERQKLIFGLGRAAVYGGVAGAAGGRFFRGLDNSSP